MRWSLGLTAVVLLGCAHAPLLAPEQGGRRWIELASPHFFLHTDLSPRQARAVLADFEQNYAILEDLGFPSLRALKPHRGERLIDVILFRREEDFAAVAPAGAAGYFTPGINNDVERTPVIVMHGSVTAETRRRFQHELTHRFISTRLRQGPVWLEEGLAEYYSTILTIDGEVYLGVLPIDKLFITEIRSYIGLLDRWREYRIPTRYVPPLAEILKADYGSFHRAEQEVYNYSGAWTFVHMLNHGPPGYRARFDDYLADLARGVSHETAWNARFGDVTMDTLGQQFHEYVQRVQLPFRHVSYVAPNVRISRHARTLAPAEVHLLWARVRPWDSRENIVRAGQDLRLAQRLQPANPEIHYWMSLYHQRWRRFTAAERELRDALMQRPHEPRYWHALAQLLYAQGRPSDEAVQRLADIAQSPAALNFLARYYHEQGNSETGLLFARRAIELEPGCWECADTFDRLSQPKEAQ